MLEKVLELCKENNISIARLERECEIGNGTITRWDKSEPSLRNLKKVADFFKVPVEYFLS